MSRRPFQPSELDGVDDPAGSAGLLAMARELERLDSGAIRPSDGFTERVLAAIGSEPLPRPMGVAGLAARQGRLGAMVAALRDTWHVAWTGGRPLAARAQAMAFVLLLIVAVGSLSGLATAGAFNALFPPSQPSPRPTPALLTSPSPSVEPTQTLPEIPPTTTPEPTQVTGPTRTPEPTDTPEPGDTTGPNGTPRHTERPGHTETPDPTETPEPGDTGGGSDGGGNSSDHGGNSNSNSSGNGSDSGGGSPHP